MKQKTLQTQYNLIKEGKGNKEIFLKEAKRIFPNYIPNAATFNQAENILKQKSIISENVWGVTTGKNGQPDWFKIFNENMNAINEEVKEGDKLKMVYPGSIVAGKTGTVIKVTDGYVTVDFGNGDVYGVTPGRIKDGEILAEVKILNEEVKAVEKKASKEVTDLEEKNFDYKDKKNIDNVYGEAFLKGYYCEMKDPKNADKTVDELKEIVAKNLAKDQLHYVKDGQFGEKGVGYTDEVPGLKASKSDQMEKVKLQESKESLKEYTDNNFSGRDTLMGLSSPSYEAEDAFEEFFPMGYASQDDAADALIAHDKSPIKARMGRYAPMFVHVQYHEFTDEAGEKYRVHQTQYYNSNFKDSDPNFNPGVTVLTLTKLADPDNPSPQSQKDIRLGEIAVKTDEYIKDLRNLNISDRVSESTIPSLLDLIGESYDEFQRDDKGAKDVAAKDKGEEDAYGAGVKKGEEIEKAKAKKPKKESIETKLAEIDKNAKVVALEAKIEALEEIIEAKSQRLEMVNEDADLAELMDKKKIKEIQKEIKDLEKRKSKMEKLYEKSCGRKYQRQEIVDETQIEETKITEETVNEELYDFVRDIKSVLGTNNHVSVVLNHLGRKLSRAEYAALAQAGVIKGRRYQQQEIVNETQIEETEITEEKKNDWPEVVDSRYGEYKFELEKVMSDRAKYKVIDVETGKEEIGGRVYGTPSQLQAAADDLIKPAGGRQSSQF